MSTTTNSRQQIKHAPDVPGVYLYRDGAETCCTWARRSRSRSASPATCPRWAERSGDGSRREVSEMVGRAVDRGVDSHHQRGGGAPAGAQPHQATPAALQHPPARRQVVPVHHDHRSRTNSPGSCSPGSSTGAGTSTSGRSPALRRCARRWTCSGGCSRCARVGGLSRGRR